MNNMNQLLIPMTAGALGLLAVTGSAADTPSPVKNSSAGTSAAVEEQRSDAQKAGDAAIDADAVAAIEEAQNAVKAIGDGKVHPALAAIERATGKINILMARKPSTALIPVRSDVSIIDLAPRDPVAVETLSDAASSAVLRADYPKARLLLDQLTSEIHIKTYNLPLATYPLALQTAARLLDQKKNEEARQTLLTALNTLVVTDSSMALPVIEAQGSIQGAEAKRTQDKAGARQLLATAKQDLRRAKSLGYANKDPAYASLDQSIADLDKQLGGPENTSSGFARLREKMSALLERMSHKETTPPQTQAKNEAANQR